ncbi:interleukin-20 receptor subunit alpha [Neosynchiropus ocellatus]
MWILLVFLKLGAFYSTVSPSPATPSNVRFSSINLRNVLHWLPGNSTTEDAHFTVQYAIYGDSVESGRGRQVNWRAVRHCTEILQNWCDLSNETWDLDHWYHARVRVKTRESSSKWARTWRRFDPKLDTIFGPPTLMVELQNNSAIITLKGPMRYQPNNDTDLVPMASLYPRMKYDLSINNTYQNKNDVFHAVATPHKYQQMEANTKFCFSARTSFLSLPVVCQASPWHCVTTPPDPATELLKMVVAGFIVATLSLCFLVVVGFFLVRYLTGKGQKSPPILNEPVFDHPPRTFPPDKPNIILISIIKDKLPSVISRAYQAQSNPAPAAAYPQLINNSGRGEHDGDDLSVDYGAVVAVPRNAPEIAREFGDSGGLSPQLLDSKTDSRFSNDHQAAVAAPRLMSYFPQQSKQEHTPMYSRKSMSTLVQAQRFDPELRNGNQAWWLHSQRAEVEREERRGENLAPITRQLETFGGVVEEKTGEERQPFLSGYASQGCHGWPSFQSNQSDCSTDYGFVMSSSRETESEETGSVIDWDPETRRLTLPMLEIGLGEGLEAAETGSERPMMEAEEENETNSPMKLDSVLVKQNSDEKETQGEWEEDIMVTKWNVVISMDG